MLASTEFNQIEAWVEKDTIRLEEYRPTFEPVRGGRSATYKAFLKIDEPSTARYTFHIANTYAKAWTGDPYLTAFVDDLYLGKAEILARSGTSAVQFVTYGCPCSRDAGSLIEEHPIQALEVQDDGRVLVHGALENTLGRVDLRVHQHTHSYPLNTDEVPWVRFVFTYGTATALRANDIFSRFEACQTHRLNTGLAGEAGLILVPETPPPASTQEVNRLQGAARMPSKGSDQLQVRTVTGHQNYQNASERDTSKPRPTDRPPLTEADLLKALNDLISLGPIPPLTASQEDILLLKMLHDPRKSQPAENKQLIPKANCDSSPVIVYDYAYESIAEDPTHAPLRRGRSGHKATRPNHHSQRRADGHRTQPESSQAIVSSASTKVKRRRDLREQAHSWDGDRSKQTATGTRFRGNGLTRETAIDLTLVD